jgi:hypothetical protein
MGLSGRQTVFVHVGHLLGHVVSSVRTLSPLHNRKQHVGYSPSRDPPPLLVRDK